MTKTVVAVLMLLTGIWSSGCGNCSPTGPSGPPSQFSGSVAGGTLAFHDLEVPANTDSVDVLLHWTPAEAQLQLIQIDPSCDPTQTAACPRFGDPQRPRPNGSPTTIDGSLSHQGTSALGRVRFVIENLTVEIGATYSVAATPKRHGCDK